MGVIGLIGRHLGWNNRRIRIASAVLDLVYLTGFVFVLYQANFFMGQIHYCNEIFQANFGWNFGMNQSFNYVMNISPNASQIWNNSPIPWLPH
jgi:hypothetical protein